MHPPDGQHEAFKLSISWEAIIGWESRWVVLFKKKKIKSNNERGYF